MENKTEYIEGFNFNDGFRNGKMDKLLNLPMNAISITCNIGEYAKGYKSGYNYKYYEIFHKIEEEE